MYKPEDIGLLISSHKNYSAPLKQLLESISKYAYDTTVYCFIGGADCKASEYWEFGDDGFMINYVDHNSFDYTGLIEIVRVNTALPCKAFLCLQDTMEIGPRTIELACQVDENHYATAAFGGQCNLVLYRSDYLLKMKSIIELNRNISKLDSIQNEGYLWKILTLDSIFTHHHKIINNGDIYGHYANANCIIRGKSNSYGGAERIEEYYSALDIVKYKANYGQNMDNLILQP